MPDGLLDFLIRVVGGFFGGIAGGIGLAWWRGREWRETKQLTLMEPRHELLNAKSLIQGMVRDQLAGRSTSHEVGVQAVVRGLISDIDIYDAACRRLPPEVRGPATDMETRLAKQAAESLAWSLQCHAVNPDEFWSQDVLDHMEDLERKLRPLTHPGGLLQRVPLLNRRYR